VEGTGKTQLEPGQEIMGDVPVQVNSENYTVRICLPNIVRIMQPRMIKIGSACSARGGIRNKFDLVGLK
jgi:hypothetical protein